MIDIDLRAITAVERRDGFVWLQPQPYGAKGTGIPYEASPPFGLFGQPRGPTSGGATNCIVLRDGPEGFVIATTDPRYQDLLPDTGDGGAGLYACVEQGGTKKTPHIAIFGADGAAAEGLLRISVPSSVGTTTIEIDPSAGDVTITHPGGTTLTIKGTGVELGAAGGFNVVVDNGTIAAWASAVVSGLAGLGVTVPALAGYAATKVKAT